MTETTEIKPVQITSLIQSSLDSQAIRHAWVLLINSYLFINVKHFYLLLKNLKK